MHLIYAERTITAICYRFAVSKKIQIFENVCKNYNSVRRDDVIFRHVHSGNRISQRLLISSVCSKSRRTMDRWCFWCETKPLDLGPNCRSIVLSSIFKKRSWRRFGMAMYSIKSDVTVQVECKELHFKKKFRLWIRNKMIPNVCNSKPTSSSVAKILV